MLADIFRNDYADEHGYALDEASATDAHEWD